MLTVCDLSVGTGDVVKAGATVTAHYVGVGAASGKQFDSSWDRGKPATFSLGQRHPRLAEGHPRHEGRRPPPARDPRRPRPTAPTRPSGSGIAANEALVFVVDLVPTPTPTVGPHVDRHRGRHRDRRGRQGAHRQGQRRRPPRSPSSRSPTSRSGTGAEVKPGATVTANYVGVGGLTGKTFDSSFTSGQPATFPLANVIPGWQDGIPGMKVGGRRLLVIPAAQAYGANPPAGSGIEKDEPLVFVVDIVSAS